MTYVKDSDFQWTSTLPFKEQMLQALANWMRRNGIPTRRTYAKGLYTVDIIDSLREELGPISEENCKASLRELVKEASTILGGYT